MSIKRFTRLAGASLLTALFGVSSSVSAQTPTTITAAVPVMVNVNATIIITPPAGLEGAKSDGVSMLAYEQGNLNITLASGTSSVSYMARGRGAANIGFSHSGGNISLKLPAQQYGRAEIGLFSVNGKQVLNGRSDAAGTGLKISRPNVAPGVYLLSVKGVDGNSYQTRLTHSGGRLNINAAFGVENGRTATMTAKMAKGVDGDEDIEELWGEWTIRANAVGYIDTSYKFIPVEGMNELQNITLISELAGSKCPASDVPGEKEHYGKIKPVFVDGRDCRGYVYQKIGSQTWMAENLNYAPVNGNSWCYNNSPEFCDNGRLYDWNTAMGAYSPVPGGFANICPAGWHLPTDEEWTTLVIFAGGTGDFGERGEAGIKLKTKEGWTNGGGTDDFGFSALPVGQRHASGVFGGTTQGFWWTATPKEEDDTFAYYRHMAYHNHSVARHSVLKKESYSVRCVTDAD